MSAQKAITTVLERLSAANLNFPIYPCVISDLQQFAMPDGLGLQIRGLSKPILLRGQLVKTVIPWILQACDGSKILEEILEACPDGSNLLDLEEGLLLLFRKGVIVSRRPELVEQNHERFSKDKTLQRQLLFWGRQLGTTRSNQSSTEVIEKIEHCKILLIANGLLGVMCYDMLSRCGFKSILVVNWDSDAFFSESLELSPVPPLAVLNTNSSLEQLNAVMAEWLPALDFTISALRKCGSVVFSEINRLSMTHHKRWLSCNDRNHVIDIGPTIDPYSSACWTCMQLRQISTQEEAICEALYDGLLCNQPDHNVLVGESITMATMAAAMLTEESIRLASMINEPSYIDTVLSIKNNGTFASNKIRRVPRCPDCYRGNTELLIKDSGGERSNEH